jgi:hypothetical protein
MATLLALDSRGHLRVLVVLFKVDLQRVTILEFERDAPRPVDMDGISNWPPSQGMEIKPRDIHVLGTQGTIESVESP